VVLLVRQVVAPVAQVAFLDVPVAVVAVADYLAVAVVGHRTLQQQPVVVAVAVQH